LHVFLDKSIMEVFVAGGKQTVARVTYAAAGLKCPESDFPKLAVGR